VVPFIKRLRCVDALVALQADEIAPERAGERLSRLGLADTGHAFDKQRLAEGERQERGGRQPLVGQIIRPAKRRRQRLGARERQSIGQKNTFSSDMKWTRSACAAASAPAALPSGVPKPAKRAASSSHHISLMQS
jgi:hypothetical protein